MKSHYKNELQLARDALREAAPLCRFVQHQIDIAVLEKRDRSPATVADFGAQALICRHIRASFPSDPIIAEEDSESLRQAENEDLRSRVVSAVQETTRRDAPESDVLEWIDLGTTEEGENRFWTLDPIDGTKGFLRREQYAISLALVEEGKVVVAALGCPNIPVADGSSGALFYAVKDQGAYVTSLFADAPTTRIQVSPQGNSALARFCESVESGHSSHSEFQRVARELKVESASVRMDSQAKYAVVARGDAEIYLRLPTDESYQERIWDHAPGALIVLEAGGRVSDTLGKPLDFGQGSLLVANRGVVATNGLLHDAVLRTLDRRP